MTESPAEINGTPEVTHVAGVIWKDTQGRYWFNDETEADLIGPFTTREICEQEAYRYGQWLQDGGK